jgi:rubrerythrin
MDYPRRSAIPPPTFRSAGRDNRSAVAETYEYTDMYPGMAKAARSEGFDEIADWFETLAKAERSHANRFQKASTRWPTDVAPHHILQ